MGSETDGFRQCVNLPSKIEAKFSLSFSVQKVGTETQRNHLREQKVNCDASC